MTPRRVVVRPPNWLGDAIMALPALGAIRRHFADAHLTVAAAPAVAPVFRERTAARPDEVLELPADTRRAVARLAGEGFDVGILLPNSFRSAWQFWRAGIGERWGVARSGRGMLLTRRAPKPSAEGRLHQAEYYRRVVAGLGIGEAADEPPRLEPGAASKALADELLARRGLAPVTRMVGLAPGAAYGGAKQWPPARMADLAVRLVRGDEAACVIVGAAHDRDAARAIESWVRTHAPEASSRIVNLVGHTSLGAVAAVMARSAVFVSNDSGAMHLASAAGCPVVAIFGPTDERATHPVGQHTVLTAPVFCRPCMLRECPIDHRCMKRITVDRVHEAVRAALAAAEGAA